MHPSVNKALKVVSVIIVIILVAMILAMITVYRESRKVESRIQDKIDRAIIQPPIKIVRYDSSTQAKLDTIEARRSLSHRHVDNLYNSELQSVLDSMYNAVQR